MPALEWGCLNEENARQQYYALASTQHINFQLQLSGLHIDTQHPYLGATPDGIVSCDCLVQVFLKSNVLLLTSIQYFQILMMKKFICKEMVMESSCLAKPINTIFRYRHSFPPTTSSTLILCVGLHAVFIWSAYMLIQSSWSQFDPS